MLLEAVNGVVPGMFCVVAEKVGSGAGKKVGFQHRLKPNRAHCIIRFCPAFCNIVQPVIIVSIEKLATCAEYKPFIFVYRAVVFQK